MEPKVTEETKKIINEIRETQLSQIDALRVIRATVEAAQIDKEELIEKIKKSIETHELKPEDAEAGRKKGSFFGDPIIILGH